MSQQQENPFTFTIGQGLWEKEIRYYTDELHDNYWAGFRPVRGDEIVKIERKTNRTLPGDFKEFLRVFGCGHFPLKYGGDISDPEELVLGCHSHLWMVLGSAKWAAPEEQFRFYVSRGKFNPNPANYTTEALIFDDINLLDLLQIGANGMGCYHQIYVGENHSTFGYCLLTPETTMEDVSPSFSEGLRRMLTHHWQWDNESE